MFCNLSLGKSILLPSIRFWLTSLGKLFFNILLIGLNNILTFSCHFSALGLFWASIKPFFEFHVNHKVWRNLKLLKCPKLCFNMTWKFWVAKPWMRCRLIGFLLKNVSIQNWWMIEWNYYEMFFLLLYVLCGWIGMNGEPVIWENRLRRRNLNLNNVFEIEWIFLLCCKETMWDVMWISLTNRWKLPREKRN